jgi:acyl-coenzyme A thioesterase PaaI-like protein
VSVKPTPVRHLQRRSRRRRPRRAFRTHESDHEMSSSRDKMAFLRRMLEGGARARFLRRHSFSHQLFGKHEQQQPSGGFTEWSSDGALRFVYKVPPCVCVAHDTMPLSAIVAMVDEVTTWASICEDRSRRAGVSISLEAQLVEQDRPPVAGDELVFSAKVEKVGRNLGFQSCEVHDAMSGRLVARGYHTKALDMGRAWNMAFGPLLPVTERVIDVLGVDRPAPVVDASSPAVLQRLIAPRRLDIDIEAGSAIADYTCLPEHLQETNLMFGGTQAMLHEMTARAAAEAALQRASGASAPALHCCSMLVRYLAGSALGDELVASATATPIFRGDGAAASSRLSPAGRATSVRSEAEVQFIRS